MFPRWFLGVTLSCLGTCAARGVPVDPQTTRQALGTLGVPMSPCPAVFRYERRKGLGGDGVWVGVVTVPAPPMDMPLVLRVDLALAAALTTKYAGTLQLQEGRRALLTRLAAGDRRPVRYLLRFPVSAPLPAITRVHVLGKDLCHGPGPPGPQSVTTTISLEHSVRPEPVEPIEPVAQPPVRLFSQTDSEAAVSEDDDEVCGRPVHHRLLVAGGSTSSPGDWPWLAAVFATTSLGLDFHCAGSLVSAGFVVTAAHCVSRLSPNALLVYVGRHNVRRWTEPQAQAREVEAIFVHPDHQAVNYTADVAVLQLAERVAYDWFVRPVCIDWTGPEGLAAVVGRVGTVVGWGRDDRGRTLSPEPRSARLPIVAQEVCLRSRPEFVHVTSERTFCAGFRNGSGPCNGDSGSGFVLPAEAAADASSSAAGPWFLRGVVSLSMLDGERLTCDLHHFVVFTDIAKFRGWLGAVIRPRSAASTSPASPPAPARHVKTVETQVSLSDLDTQPIWDSDPD